jgi:uncharacterized phage protein (TIGR02218 family)
VKTIPIALAAQYDDERISTLCTCLKITRQDGTTFAVTSADIDVAISGVTLDSDDVLDGTYLALHGLDVSAIVSSAGVAVDNAELSVIPEDGDDALELDLQTGKFDNARFVLFETNYLNPADGVNVIKRGSTGEAQINRGVYTIEFRGLKQAFQQLIGAVTSKTCRYRLGVNDTYRSRCPVVIADFTEAVAVTAVTSRYVFTIDTAQADDWSGDGLIRFLDGENAGYECHVKSLVGGVVTLKQPAPFTITPGDTAEHVAGCRKRFEEDCRDKFGVPLDFGGEPHLPGIDHLTSAPESDV